MLAVCTRRCKELLDVRVAAIKEMSERTPVASFQVAQRRPRVLALLWPVLASQTSISGRGVATSISGL
jgi:hypothetical protein